MRLGYLYDVSLQASMEFLQTPVLFHSLFCNNCAYVRQTISGIVRAMDSPICVRHRSIIFVGTEISQSFNYTPRACFAWQVWQGVAALALGTAVDIVLVLRCMTTSLC
jgi:hypothetical protein